jgi:endonuclease/exonuclease/phosphatase family metal-dependent hydrolase
LPQADYLAPEGYEAVYRTNATTRHGEHGNAMLSRWPVLSQQHRDISDHRFEQRGFLHTEVQVVDRVVHVIVVHLGLVPASRLRQTLALLEYIESHIEPGAPVLVAGDFNDWGTSLGRRMANAGFAEWREQPTPTYPSRLPLNQLDHVYARGLKPVHAMAPSGRVWPRMSDHLPLVAEFAWD